MNSNELRSSYINFFQQKLHQQIDSAPLYNPNDPSLLFTNAGMNQFKHVLLGQDEAKHTRLVNSQPCIRVSGKHNDLEEVGLDDYHHTLFEMLGNWSFGDYWKEEAIVWAWEWITECLGLPKEKLYATYHHNDEETKHIWLEKTNIDPQHVLVFGDKDNFWEMGATGPCGPCTEIHFDRGESACTKDNSPEKGSCVNGSSARYFELWNLVFIQYNREEDSSLTKLKTKSVDTGAGLERLCTVLQQKQSNYETDLFYPIIQQVEKLSGRAYSSDTLGMPHRVLADHTRALCFALADGVIPSNEGRGYVLRRLIRRALNYASQLNVNKPIIVDLCDCVCDQFMTSYPKVSEKRLYIKEIILKEERQFLNTLESGLERFESVKSKSNSFISGEDAFKLYDTFGFPIDLTELLAKQAGLEVDIENFNSLLKLQKQRSRKNQKTDEIAPEILAFKLKPSLESCIHQGVYTQQAGGGEARLPQNSSQRFLLAQHHSAVHLLHSALLQTYGKGIKQTGAMKDLNKFRFDFSYDKSISSSELKELEKQVNQWISQGLSIVIKECSLEEAKKEGAIATFGEKYSGTVRMVSIGDISKELCGGNHVNNTRLIEAVKLLKQSSVAAGIRRIEGICSYSFIKDYEEKQKEDLFKQVQNILEKLPKSQKNTSDPNFGLLSSSQVKNLNLDALKDYLKTLKHLKKLAATKKSKACVKYPLEQLSIKQEKIANSLIIKWTLIENSSLEVIKNIADQLSDQKNMLIILGNLNEKNSQWVVKSNNPHIANASHILKELLDYTGGKGGGKASFAQGVQAQSSLMKEAILSTLKTLHQKKP